MGATVVRGHDWEWEDQDGRQCMKYIDKCNHKYDG